MPRTTQLPETSHTFQPCTLVVGFVAQSYVAGLQPRFLDGMERAVAAMATTTARNFTVVAMELCSAAWTRVVAVEEELDCEPETLDARMPVRMEDERRSKLNSQDTMLLL